MELLTLDQAADLLATAAINDTHDLGHAIVHTGTTESGARFTLMNDTNGHSCVSYQS